jgi:hypothetical protein
MPHARSARVSLRRRLSPRLGVPVVGICLLAAGCHSRTVAVPTSPGVALDQSNTPPWEGGWSAIGRGSPVVRFAQTVTPLKARLTAVDIDIMTANRGREGDDITVKIMDGGRVLASVSRFVPEGQDGMLRFEFASPGVTVTPGVPFQLQVEDTNKDVFGWRYGLDTYPGGVAYFNGAPWINGTFDFRFRTYGY